LVAKKKIAVLLAVLLIMTTLPGLALGVQVSLDLSWNSTAAGNNITASGSADPDEWVSIKVLDNAQGIVFYDAVKSDASGKYSCTFTVPQVSPGALTVVAGYGTNVANKSLLISDGGGITPVTLNRIEITKPATKLVYTVGDSLDIAGLKVTGYYSDGSSRVEPISAASISGFDSSKPATQQTLTITIGGKITTYEVSITKKSEEGSTDNKGGGSSTVPAGQTTGQTVSSSGGTVKEAGVEVTFPANAVTSDIKVTVKKLSSGIPAVSSGFKLLGEVYEITSETNSNFKKPVTITLPFDRNKLDSDKHNLAIYWWSNNQWVILDKVKVDLKAGKVSGEVNHFSKFAVLLSEKSATDTPLDEDKEPIKDVIVPVKAVVKDVSGHWAETSINILVNRGAISGYPGGSFKPDNTITRAEFATILIKAFNLEPRSGKVFSDTSGHWAEHSIRTATAHGIVSGYNASNFGPNDIITREQMAVMIVKAAKLTNVAEGRTFDDAAQVSNWAKKAVGIASGEGIISGYPDNTFKPKANATRAEAVTVIIKAL
jgi:hypothetical protein